MKDTRRKGRTTPEILERPTPGQRPLLDQFFHQWRHDENPNLTAAEIDARDADSIAVGEGLMSALRLIEAGEQTKRRHERETPARAARWAAVDATVHAMKKNEPDVEADVILATLQSRFGKGEFHWKGPPEMWLKPLTKGPLQKRLKLVLDKIKEQKKSRPAP